MQLINDIINELIDSQRSISSPLLKTKVLASRLKNKELLDWANKELNGYDSSDVLPEYRRYGCSVIGSYINGNMKVTNQVLPTSGIPSRLEELAKHFEFYQGVAAIESLEKQNKSGQLEAAFPAEITALLQDNIVKQGNHYFQLISAKKVISIGAITQILSVIRSKLLDFMLKIDEEFGNIAEIEELKHENKKISTIMNQTIINAEGDGNIINAGDNNSISAEIKINKGDKQALQKRLNTYGIKNQDQEDLIKIIDTEIPDKSSKKFGPHVNKWIQTMLGKALDGSWQVAVGTAGNLLVEAISSYYGLNS